MVLKITEIPKVSCFKKKVVKKAGDLLKQFNVIFFLVNE
jgi:hypothetical protein